MAEESAPNDIQKAVEATYNYADALLREGKSRAEVEAALVAKGIERATAGVVVEKAARARAAERPRIQAAAAAEPSPMAEHIEATKKEEGSRNMIIGGLICLVGIVITAVTYSAASEGGGKYVVAWGAIIFGAIRFFRGLSQMSG